MACARLGDYLALDDAAISAHLAGHRTLGVYPLIDGDRCRFLACDFDQHSWPLDALHWRPRSGPSRRH